MSLKVSHLGRGRVTLRIPPPHSLTPGRAALNPRRHKRDAIKKAAFRFHSATFLIGLNPNVPNCDHRCATARPSSAILENRTVHAPQCPSPSSQIFTRSSSHGHNAQPEREARTRNEPKMHVKVKRFHRKSSFLQKFLPLSLCKSTVASESHQAELIITTRI